MAGDSSFSSYCERDMNNFLRGNLILDTVTSKKPLFYLISIKGSNEIQVYSLRYSYFSGRPHDELKKMCCKPIQVLNAHVNRDSY